MKKRFYGWVNLAAGCLMLFAILGLVNATLSQFIKPISDDLGETRAAVALMASLMGITAMIFNFSYGKIVSRIGFKRMIVIGLLTSIFGVFMYSFATKAWMLYGSSLLIGFGFAFAGMIPVSTVVSNWFYKKRGLAMGIVLASSGFGGMIFNPIMGRLIVNLGWRRSFQIEAVILAVLGLMGVLLLVPHPKDKGQQPYGYEETNNKQTGATAKGLSMVEARKTPCFKFLAASMFVAALAVQPVLITIPAYFSDIGYGATYGAGILSLVFMVNTVSKIGSGIINDRLGLRAVMAIDYGAFGIAMVLLLFTDWTYAFAVVFGLALTLMAVPLPLMVSHYFGEKDYSAIYGVQVGILTIGLSLSTMLVNLVFDRFGSYMPYFVASGVMAVISAVFFVAADLKKPNWNAEANMQTETGSMAGHLSES